LREKWLEKKHKPRNGSTKPSRDPGELQKE